MWNHSTSIAIALGLFVCFTVVYTARNANTNRQSKLANCINDFAFSLYRKIGQSVVGRNAILSPVSISTALAMVYLGARGDTRSQITSAMHLNAYNSDDKLAIRTDFRNLLQTLDDPRNNYTLDIANRLFGDKSYIFSEEFLQDTETYFQAALEAVDFSGDPTKSRLHINDWVSEKTSGKIQDLLPDGSIKPVTALVLVNAIYFKGLWSNPFSKRSTKSETFHLTRDKDTSIEMMNSERISLKYYNSTDLGCQVVELSYVGDKSSMLILLPHEIDGLPSVESRLGAESLENIFKGLQNYDVKVSLPKFAIDQGLALKTFLQAVGIVDLFEGKADLSGIDGSRRLSVSAVIHKAFVEVNEEGTEAAGATGAIVNFRSSPVSQAINFVADRPFLFLIVEKSTGTILFLGRLTEPPKTDEKSDIGFEGETAKQRCCESDPNESNSANVQHLLHRAWCYFGTAALFIAGILLSWRF